MLFDPVSQSGQQSAPRNVNNTKTRNFGGYLEESSFGDVDDGGSGGVGGSGLAIFLRNQRPQLLDINRAKKRNRKFREIIGSPVLLSASAVIQM